MGTDKTAIVHIPSLVATLLNAENAKGTPLSEAEVLKIRDEAPARVVRPEEVIALEERRGYQDIDPENCWVEWQQAREEFVSED